MHYPILVRILVKTIKKPNLSQPFLAFPTFSAFQQVDVLSQIRRKGKHNPSWEFSQKSGKKLFFAKKGEGGGTFFSPAALLVKCNLPPFSGDQGSTRGPQVGQKYRWDQFFFGKMVFLPKKSHGEVFFSTTCLEKYFSGFFWTLQNEDILEGGYLL